MTLTQEQLREFISFIEKLNSKQSSYYSGSLRPNSKKNECFKKVLSILNFIYTRTEPVHVTWISLILKYLLKVSLLISNLERFELTSTAKGLFDINVTPDTPYNFEDYESLKLDFIRVLRNKNDIDKALGLNKIINNNYPPELLMNDDYQAECYEAFSIVLDEMDEIRSASSLESAPYYHELNKKLKIQCPIYQEQLLFKSETVALVYSEKCVFQYELEKFLKKNQVTYIMLPYEVDPWVRDIFIDTNTKLYLRSRSKTKWEIDLKEVIYSETEKDHKNYSMPRLDDKSREIKYFTRLNRDIQETVRPLEGGNLFTAKNKEGQEYYFIGNDAILFDIDFHMAKGVDPSFKKEVDLEIRKELIKQKYVKIFGVGSKVIILPQWTYHLDLQMAYIGKSTFLLHSFEKTQEFNKSKIPSEYDIVEKKIDEIYEILVKEGFNVYKCCAILYNDYPQDTKHLYDVKNVSSSFINGIDISTKKGNFFLTNDSPIDLHKDYFENFMRGLKVTPVFLNIFEYEESDTTTTYIVSKSGALRCQTNFIRVNE